VIPPFEIGRREIALAGASTLLVIPAWLLLQSRFDLGPTSGNYFFSLRTYLIIIGAAGIASLGAAVMGRGAAIITICACALLWGWGYLGADLVYQGFRAKLLLSGMPLISQDAASYMNVYLVGKLYQIIPLAIIFVALFAGRRGASHWCRIGYIRTMTTILNRRKPMPWSAVVARIIMYLAVVFVVMIAVNPRTSGAPLGMVIPIVLYAMVNCAMEEAMFRGLFLPRFTEALGFKWGNLLQAFLFGLVHWPSFNMVHYLEKVVIFTFLGWLFGRATRETGGLSASWLVHTAIVTMVELRALL
jgi:membrane protease YdiL (CAAX protease family)